MIGESAVLGDWRESLYFADKAVAANPNSAEAYRYRGNGRNKANNVQGALEDYNRAIELDPSRSVYYRHRANLKKSFDKNGAIQDFRIAIKVAMVDPHISYIRMSVYKEIIEGFQSLGVPNKEIVREFQSLGFTNLNL
jgi:tetratricopeptide (TPR) repeat protein